MAKNGRALQALFLVALMGCTGTISDLTVSREVGNSQGNDQPDGIPDVDTDGDGIPDLDTGLFADGSQGDGDGDGDGDGKPGDGDGDPGPVTDPGEYNYATLGERCRASPASWPST